MNSLIEQFIAEEATPYARKLIAEAVNRHQDALEGGVECFEFNRFDLKLNFSENYALLEDVIDANTSGEIKLSLEDFLNLLGENIKSEKFS
jgi:hypothetical protein